MIPPSTPIGRLGLSARATGVLRLAGLTTFGQVSALSAAQLVALPHFTATCLEELLAVAQRGGQVVAFLSRAELRRRLHVSALWWAAECDRIGDQWAEAQATLERTVTELAKLSDGGGA